MKLSKIDQALIHCYRLQHTTYKGWVSSVNEHGFSTVMTFEDEGYWDEILQGRPSSRSFSEFKRDAYEDLIRYYLPEAPHKVKPEIAGILTMLQGYLIRVGFRPM